MIKAFRALSKSQGWELLVEFAEKQIENRVLERNKPSEGMDDLVKKEYLNGEIAGIKLFCAMPGLIIEDFEQQLEALKEEVKNED